jgi:hypothetical protein
MIHVLNGGLQNNLSNHFTVKGFHGHEKYLAKNPLSFTGE